MNTIKQKILDASVSLMMEKRDLEQVTMRRIASRASVSLGVINYHFQTKKNLMNLSVRSFMSALIEEWEKEIEIEKGQKSLMELQIMLSSFCDFLVRYPRICRMSLLFEIQNPSSDDNSVQTIDILYREAAKVFSLKDPNDIKVLSRMCIASLQHFFLRSFGEKSSPDFFVEKERIEFITRLLAIFHSAPNSERPS